MGFGKYIIGGICAVGAVVAAPVVLPAAGMAIAASSVTGMVGITAGLAIATTSTTTAAVVAGAAGTVAGEIIEKKKIEKDKDVMYNRGKTVGAAGKDEMKNAYEEQIKGKDEIIHKQEEMNRQNENYIKEQDAIIDGLMKERNT